MRRRLAILGALIMVFSLCGCSGGKKAAFSASKEAYDNINSAYVIVDEYGSNLYEAWRLGIYKEDDLSLDFLAKELNMDKEDLKAGVAYLFYEEEWASLTQEEKEEKISNGESLFDFALELVDSKFSFCVEVVSDTYKANGKVEKVQELLSTAKGQMKMLSEKYSDYEHYPALKGYYTTTNAFFDFCMSPSGSFEQVKTTINDYRNDCRNYEKDLNYIFED